MGISKSIKTAFEKLGLYDGGDKSNKKHPQSSEDPRFLGCGVTTPRHSYNQVNPLYQEVNKSGVDDADTVRRVLSEEGADPWDTYWFGTTVDDRIYCI